MFSIKLPRKPLLCAKHKRIGAQYLSFIFLQNLHLNTTVRTCGDVGQFSAGRSLCVLSSRPLPPMLPSHRLSSPWPSQIRAAAKSRVTPNSLANAAIILFWYSRSLRSACFLRLRGRNQAVAKPGSPSEPGKNRHSIWHRAHEVVVRMDSTVRMVFLGKAWLHR